MSRLLALTLFAALPTCPCAFVTPSASRKTPSMATTQEQMSALVISTRLAMSLDDDDDDDNPDAAEHLPLSLKDLARMTEMESRTTTLPIIIMDAILPGQRLTFESNDPKFQKLIDYAKKHSNDGEIGMIGFNPHTGSPLNVGVTFSIKKGTIFQKPRPFSRALMVSATGERRFEVLDEPWLDDSGSFYLAQVDIVDNRHEIMTPELEAQTFTLHEAIPQMVQEWVGWVVKANKATRNAMSERLRDLGPMPKSPQQRAIWVGALVNPPAAAAMTTNGNINDAVCPEIRPAMLSCRHDHDRLVLASTALRSSIAHLSGRTNLFE